MKRLALLLLVFSASLASAEQLLIEPAAPTSRSFVMLRVRSQWSDYCLPQNARVTRDANVINVHWSLPKGVGCGQAIAPWNDDVEIGVLEPGTYVLRVRVDDFTVFDAKTFTVAEPNPSVIATPSIASTRGGTQVLFDLAQPSDDFCPPGQGRPPITLTVGGVSVQHFDMLNCMILAILPPHAAGAVDVTVRFLDRTYTSRSVLRYVDPSATPDPEAFERVLVPILFNGPRRVRVALVHGCRAAQPLRAYPQMDSGRLAAALRRPRLRSARLSERIRTPLSSATGPKGWFCSCRARSQMTSRSARR